MEYRTQPMVRRTEEPQICEDHRGRLPACAPLANPYVPYQQNNPATYPAKEGIIKGTLFPGLNLPFMGKENTQLLCDCPLHELQSLGFALVELGEYLDTHMEDQEAFELFRSYGKLYREGREKYEKQYGPLSQKSAAMEEKYRWITEQWPWDYEANCRRED